MCLFCVLVVLIRGLFRKKIINASSNLKRDLHLEAKIKSNVYLDIGTEGILYITFGYLL